MDRAEEARDMTIEGLIWAEETSDRWYEAEVHRLKGESLRALSGDYDNEAENSFYNALEVSRRQQAKSLGASRRHQPRQIVAIPGQAPGSLRAADSGV